MPDELLATMPPIIAASIDAGSGPMRRPCGASSRFRWPPTTPGCVRTRAPSSSTLALRKNGPISTSTSSETAWPESDVPAARNVRWRRRRRAQAKSARISPSSRGRTIASGTSR